MPAGSETLGSRVRRAIRDISDFPKPGIVFKDITPLLADAPLFLAVTNALSQPFAADGVTHVAGIESRGFIFAAPASQHLGASFVPVRKPGKLPFASERVEYALEYGTDVLEIHRDACGARARVLVIDDVLATGGTAAATCALVEKVGGEVVGCSFLMALSFLPGMTALHGRRVETIVRY